MNVMEIDPQTIGNADERARVILAQWHKDEATNDAEALDYADRLIARLKEHNLFVAGHNW